MALRIGIPREIKEDEARVAVTPAGADALVHAGHQVVVEHGAGSASGFEDVAYQEAGALIVSSAAEVWSQADMILKVKEPLHQEFAFFRPGLILFTYLHLAAAPELTRALLDSDMIAVEQGPQQIEWSGKRQG